MSMMLRRGMMVPKVVPGGLPAEYLAVQYLQAPSGQYIVTNLYPDLTTSYEAEVEHNEAGDQYLVGGRVGRSSPIAGIGYYRHHFQNCYLGYFYTGDVVSGKTIYRIDMSNGSQTGYINGIQSGTGNKSIAKTGDYSPISIFGSTKNGGGIDNPFTGKCYWLKIYINNALVGHFIPCIRISDSKPGMYDLVGRQFYVNQGTGEFIAGHYVLPYPVGTRLYDNVIFTSGEKLDNTGEIIEGAGNATCHEYLPVDPAYTYERKYRLYTCAMYDENLDYIGSVSANDLNTSTVVLDSRTRYIRCTVHSNYPDSNGYILPNGNCYFNRIA